MSLVLGVSQLNILLGHNFVRNDSEVFKKINKFLSKKIVRLLFFKRLVDTLIIVFCKSMFVIATVSLNFYRILVNCAVRKFKEIFWIFVNYFVGFQLFEILVWRYKLGENFGGREMSLLIILTVIIKTVQCVTPRTNWSKTKSDRYPFCSLLW